MFIIRQDVDRVVSWSSVVKIFTISDSSNDFLPMDGYFVHIGISGTVGDDWPMHTNRCECVRAKYKDYSAAGDRIFNTGLKEYSESVIGVFMSKMRFSTK
jgi:hypothetical protein